MDHSLHLCFCQVWRVHGDWLYWFFSQGKYAAFKMLQGVTQSQQVAVPFSQTVLLNHALKEGCNRNSISQKWTLHIKYSSWIFAQFSNQFQMHYQIRNSGGFVIRFVVLAETELWEQPIGPRKRSQWSHSAAVCKFWKLGSLSFLKLRLYSWARAMWLWVCPALAKMGSPWLSPAHILFSHRLRLSSPAVPPAWAPGALLQLLLLLSHLLVIASPWQWDKAIREDAGSLWIWRTWYPFWGFRRCWYHLSVSSTSPHKHGPRHALDPYTYLRSSLLWSMNRSLKCTLRKGQSNISLGCLMQPTELHAPINSTEARKMCHELNPTSCCFAWRYLGCTWEQLWICWQRRQ